jgi:hypothetical protein
VVGAGREAVGAAVGPHRFDRSGARIGDAGQPQRCEPTAKPAGRLKLGSLLVSIAREAGGLTDAEAEQFNQLRDRTPAEPMRFE